ncbi:hypothetical protein [Ruminococcus sp. 5_1_39BFAA]|uniref:hypothetical protein n=1 Tax=Ruminococcus sp. 5_1_39BFAA TaxID=457412 RepID=UPI00356A67DF
MKKRNTNIPNYITILRIVGTVCLMPTYPLSPILWIRIPVEIWYAVAMVLLLRLSAYLAAAVKF